MQPRVWVRRTLDHGRIDGAVVTFAMVLEGDVVEIVRALARFCATQRSQLDASLGVPHIVLQDPAEISDVTPRWPMLDPRGLRQSHSPVR